MLDQGVQLQLLIGASVPAPVSDVVVDALTNVEVRNNDSSRDGFQMTFTLGRDSIADYSLLTNNYFEPPKRVIIFVILGVLPQILIDGIITNHQVVPSNRPGESSLVVTGEDISLKLDLTEKNKTYKNQSDSEIVETILREYLIDGLSPEVEPTSIRRQENEGNTTQQGTDLSFIQELARRNGFVFFVEPTTVPRRVKAYWGPQNYQSSPQPALTINMGADTNVESLSFSFDALGPATPSTVILDPDTKQQIPVPEQPSTRPPLARQPTTSLRMTLPREVANKDQALAAVLANALASASADAVTGSGQLDAVRYGRVLRARSLVDLRGAGNTYDGKYYVKQVTHTIRRGEYKQGFSLSREGRGALSPLVTV